MDSNGANSIPKACKAPWWQQLCVIAVLLLLIRWALPIASRVDRSQETGLLLTFGAIGIWRWGWGALHYTRAATYRYLRYPLLRRQARRAVERIGSIEQLVVLATTYHEQQWITRHVVRSLVREFFDAHGLRYPPSLIFVTGCDEDDETVEREFNQAVDELLANKAVRPSWQGESASAQRPQLKLLRGDQGKRPAIAAGLKYIASTSLVEDSVVVLMDGDSAPEVGSLNAILPIFRVSPRIGAVTTNERAMLQAPGWFSEWIQLRFGQRHLYMCSLALSRKLLCLTGRFSVFRGDVATNPAFIDQIENDSLEHWLYGHYQMFSGDDKSSWYWLSKNRYQMLYVADAMVSTYEIVSEGPINRAIANLKRWSGNMLRNCGRAAALGPHRLGLFPWLCVIDQRISFWTVLIGPSASLLALLAGRFDFVACYLLWICLTRFLRVMASWRHSRRISPFYVPLQLFSEWAGAAVKLWVYFHPVKQTWLNRGNRTLDSSKESRFHNVKNALASYYCGVGLLALVLAVGSYTHFLPFLQELPLVWGSLHGESQEVDGEHQPIAKTFTQGTMFGATEQALANPTDDDAGARLPIAANVGNWFGQNSVNAQFPAKHLHHITDQHWINYSQEFALIPSQQFTFWALSRFSSSMDAGHYERILNRER